MATKPFLPTRWWQWAMVPILVLPVLAILTPPCAYSGPGPGGVAKSIAYRRRDTGAWPTAYQDPVRRYNYALERIEIGGAVYRIHAGCEREDWWVAERGVCVSPTSKTQGGAGAPPDAGAVAP